MRLRSASAFATFATVATLALSGAGAATAAPAEGAAGAQAPTHGFGFDYAAAKRAHDAKGPGKHVTGKPQALRAITVAPASYSLANYAQPAGDQGQVGSCVAWATGYTGIGLLANEQGIVGDPFAPMYVYAQIAKGHDNGTYASVALPIEKSQGIDTKAHYWQGDFDYTTQPDAAEIANAANYKISGFTDLTNVADRKTAIKEAIASGLPVPIGAQVRSSIYNLTSTNNIYNPRKSDRVVGGHEITIVGYDDTYVQLENSWGTGWGKNGFFRAPWSWVTGSDVIEVHSIGKLVQQ